MTIMNKLRVGVIGATGTVGQRYIELLEGHPWFDLTLVAASAASAGKTYKEAVSGRWSMPRDIPLQARDLRVLDAQDISKIAASCDFVFCAIDMPKKDTAIYEDALASADIIVVSNNSAHRNTPDVPVLIPEINASHTDIIQAQRKRRGTKRGFVAVKPNCSLQSWLIPLYAIEQAGFPVSSVFVATLQAVSGAGRPGVSSLDIIDNIIPYISGEEEKTELEPLKVLGSLASDSIQNRASLQITAHCNRVPVIDGHTACLSLAFADKKPSVEQCIEILRSFDPGLHKAGMPMAPSPVVIVRDEPDRPQPRIDRGEGNGMTITVGRIRPCSVADIKFVGVSHNAIRGASGGGILNAELLVTKGFIDRSNA
jgi:aspartate-semialdehyde dehydrogenase